MVQDMKRGWLHPRQCVACDEEPPSCNCAPDENCVLTGRTCSQCPTIQCNKKAGESSGGPNPGVIAGPVVAVLVIASIVLFWWLRRKKRRDLARLEQLADRARKAESAGFALSPGPGSARSARSDRSRSSRRISGMPQPPPSAASTMPHSASSRRHPRTPLPPPAVQAGEYTDRNGEKVRVYAGNGTINLDPSHPDNGGLGDPFSDDKSVSTRGSGGTNQSGGTQIIPIQFVASGSGGQGEQEMYELQREQGNRSPVSQAARTLNEARENLFKGAPGMPQRPARAPGLDLRSPEAIAAAQERDLERSPQSANAMRNSYLSGTSGAPSYLSGYTTDLHLDAPKIFTSKQVQIGRLQQAEVVHFGAAVAALGGQGQQVPATANTLDSAKLSPVMYSPPHVEGAPISPALSAVRSPYGQYGSSSSSNGESLGQSRQLTPATRHADVLEEDEDLPSPDRPSDLRFSMGSLARNSVSTIGTSRSRPAHDSVVPLTPQSHPYTRSPYDPPRSAAIADNSGRESMMSARSDGSGLSAFPMIGPGAPGGRHTQGQTQGIPQSTSVTTLDHAQIGSHPHIEHMRAVGGGAAVNKPPTSYKPVAGSSRSQGPSRAPSVADSFLGEFPFRPPTSDDVDELPSARMPETAGLMTAATNRDRTGAGNRYTAMSVASEGLGAFEFRLGPGMDGDEGVPDVPAVPASSKIKDPR